MKNIFVVAIAALFTSANCYAQPAPANITNGINQLFQAHVDQGQGLVPGHVIRVEKPGDWLYENAAGFASLSPSIAAQPEMKFKVASITKMFTAVAIFKLIQNGQLSFDAPISSYLPVSTLQAFTDYEQITIKKLLSHTSGITEPQSDFQGRLNYWIFMKRFENIPLDSLLLWSSGNSAGVGNYQYSNANFYVLAEIIKSVTGQSCQDYITNTIITPLGLTNTDFNTIPTGSFMRGYLRGSFYPNGGVPDGLEPDSLYDFTEASNSWGYGAADIWSNTSDLIKFHKALFTGQLINQNWVDSMTKVITVTGDMGSYGYGMIQFNSYNNGPIYAFGHTGTAFGYGSMLAYIPSLNIYMCSAGNYMKIGQEFLQRDIYNFLKTASPTGLVETVVENTVNLYPNPTSGDLYIDTKSKNFNVTVLDVAGKMVTSTSATSINLSHLSAGIYILKLEDQDSKTILTQKFVLE